MTKIRFPNLIPIFPLNGVIYFPKTNLPLNIFEDRYLELVNDALKKDKLMGMVQSKKDSNEVYKVGCLGKISEFSETKDGRILINLTGLTRFEIVDEITNKKKYREFKVQYQKFGQDLNLDKNFKYEEQEYNLFMDKIHLFFKKNGLLLNWKEFEKLNYYQKINTIAMIAPVSNEEKQKLLETITLEEKTKTMLDIIKFYSYQNNKDKKTIQ